MPVYNMYPYILTEHKWPGYEKFTIKDLNERDGEYLDVLESNINHPLVKELHLFYTDEEALTVSTYLLHDMHYLLLCLIAERLQFGGFLL